MKKRWLFTFLLVIAIIAVALVGMYFDSSTAVAPNTGSTSKAQGPSAKNAPATASSSSAFAVIRQTASTNTKGYSITVQNDGSGVITVDNATSAIGFPPGTVGIATLKDLLSAVGNVNMIVTPGGCVKSASFGTRTTITYGGKTSGDLQCVTETNASAAAYNLADFILRTETELQIPDLSRFGPH